MQKYSVQSAQVKGRQLDLAWFSSTHGMFVNFHIQGQASPRSTPKATSPGYYSVSPVNDSVFPRLIK